MSFENLNKTGLKTETIKIINSVFEKHSHVKKVILYGSRAMGNYKSGSDIDLTLITDEKDLSKLFKIENELDDLLLPYKMDVSFYSLIDNENLKNHIQKVGVILYEKIKN